MTEIERIEYRIYRVEHERGGARVGPADNDAIYALTLAQLETARQLAVLNDYLRTSAVNPFELLQRIPPGPRSGAGQ